MRRKSTGACATTGTAGEMVRASVPAPLPPRAALVLGGPLQQVLEEATLAVGRLDTVSALLPDADKVLYTFVRKEGSPPHRLRERNPLSRTCCGSNSVARLKFRPSVGRARVAAHSGSAMH